MFVFCFVNLTKFLIFHHNNNNNDDGKRWDEDESMENIFVCNSCTVQSETGSSVNNKRNNLSHCCRNNLYRLTMTRWWERKIRFGRVLCLPHSLKTQFDILCFISPFLVSHVEGNEERKTMIRIKDPTVVVVVLARLAHNCNRVTRRSTQRRKLNSMRARREHLNQNDDGPLKTDGMILQLFPLCAFRLFTLLVCLDNSFFFVLFNNNKKP